MTFFLGRPGSLAALPHPGRGIDAELTIPGRAAGTIGGGRVVDRAPTGRRTYELNWTSLSPEQHSIVEEFYLGARGPGPFVLLDPWRRNLLTANQSAATSVTNDTSGFSPLGVAESLTSSSTVFERGPRSLAWNLPAAVTSGVLTLSAPNTFWPGIPVVPGRQYRFQARVRGGGADPVVTLEAKLRWLDIAGANMTLDTGAAIATSAGAWVDIFIPATTAPAGAAYVVPRFVVAPSSVTAAAIVYIDKPMLSMPTTSDPGTVWALGTGIPFVSCTTSPTTYRKPIKRSAGLTLVEVG